jgi:hypothetical protein
MALGTVASGGAYTYTSRFEEDAGLILEELLIRDGMIVELEFSEL